MDDFKVPTLPSQLSPTKEEEHATTAQKDADALPAEMPQHDPPETPIKSNSNLASNCPYKVPLWSAPPPTNMAYKFEVLKSGQIIEEVKELQTKAIWTFGRLTDNDIEMAHPTISRFHAVLQYRPNSEDDGNDETETKQKPAEGWYIYDLDSTHGTFLNKQRLPARVYIRVRVGHILRLGASTRSYILQGPSEDEEPESELSITEIKAQRQQQVAEAAAEALRKAEEAAERQRNEGVSWGMAEDADEETDLTHNPYASTNNEELFLDDPKRTLRGYFEREGLQLEYKCDEMSTGSFVCRVELPLDDPLGRPIIAEVVHKGRKKECVVQCALEACRILDRHGVLRQANQEPLKRKLKSKDSDSDEDEFWDRTGDVERKKQRKSNTGTTEVFTYEDLLKQETDLLATLQKVEDEISKYQETQKRLKVQKEQEGEDLDSFMENLSDCGKQLDKTEIRKLRVEEQRIKAEHQKLQRLIKIAKPATLSFTNSAVNATGNSSGKAEIVKKQLPMIGKRNQFSKFKVVKMPIQTDTTKPIKKSKAFDSDEEDEKDDETEKVKIDEEIIPKISSKAERDDEIETPIEQLKNTKPDNLAEHKEIPVSADSNKISETEEIQTDVLATNDEQTDNVTKKRRPRQRQRHKRYDNDELDEHESTEKYEKWVPPENQSGDGYTKLNDKYGY